jgi:SAM-dependent methyltransferase
MSNPRTRVGEIAKPYLDRGDATGWFEELYATAAGDDSKIPWADKKPNQNLTDWLTRENISGAGRRALVVGCGLGDDAEELARRGFAVTAFDISASAIDWCQKRFPNSAVKYVVADLFAAPQDWSRNFDFVFESYTLQALPSALREKAIPLISDFITPGGTLLIVTRGRDPQDPPGTLPWPLLKDELALFKKTGVSEAHFEDYIKNESPPVRRFRVEYRKRS